ncbi:MAG: chorismate mutase [Roseburia sp.]|nr:chorismate mutase [Roseburia sp.]
MSLDEIRQEINSIDTRMKELFLKRMECSRQVAEEKKKTKGRVYVPEREAEMVSRGLMDVPENKMPEYKMLLKQIITISRTYQYSQMGLPEYLRETLDFQGELLIGFSCKEDSDQLSGAVVALKMAGIVIQEIQTERQQEKTMCCHMRIFGDFKSSLAKGAVLQIYEENEDVSVQKISE